MACRSVRTRDKEIHPLLTVPPALSTSAEVTTKDEANAFLTSKVILLINQVRVVKNNGAKRDQTDWWFPMVAEEYSMNNTTYGKKAKSSIVSFAAHLGMSVEEYKRVKQLTQKPWIYMKKYGVVERRIWCQGVFWILLDEAYDTGGIISPASQIRGEHNMPGWLQGNSNLHYQTVETVTSKQRKEAQKARGRNINKARDQIKQANEVDKMKSRKNANRMHVVSIGRRKVSIPTGSQIVRTSAKSKETDEKKALITVNNQLKAENDKLLGDLNMYRLQLRNIESLHSQNASTISQLENDIIELHEGILMNEEAVGLGKLLLKLKKTTNCPVSPLGQRLYGIAWANLPKAAAKTLTQFIPIAVSAFLADLGISDRDLLMSVPNITPSIEVLHKAALMGHQQVYKLVASMVKRGMLFGFGHDKGERNGLGRLIRGLSFIIDGHVKECKVDANGVDSNDQSIGEHIENTFSNIQPYLDDGEKVLLGSITTDAGGGGGTLESSASKIGQFLNDIHYIINCTLHSHSKCLQKAWEQAFGGGGREEVTLLQLLHCFWSLQEALGENFKDVWKLLIEDEWVTKVLSKPILTRWGYVLQTATSVEDMYDKWEKFTSTCYELWSNDEKIHTIAKGALKIMKNDLVRCQNQFVTAFGKSYWNKHFLWLRRIDPISKLSGHSAHEMCIQVFIMLKDLDHLISNYGRMDAFAAYRSTHATLDADGQSAIDKQIFVFFKVYKTTFLKAVSGFKRWSSLLLPFTLASANTPAVTIFVRHVLKKSGVAVPEDVNLNASTTNNTHASFKLQEWKQYLEDNCEVDITDGLLVRHRTALIEMSTKMCSVWDETENASIIALREDCMNIVIPAFHHTQSIEAGVQETSICAENQKAEMIASALVAIRSNDIVAITEMVQMHLDSKDIKGNQHMGRGKSSEGRQVKSRQAIRNQAERAENNQVFKSRVQATKFRASQCIDRAFCDPFAGDVRKMRNLAYNVFDKTDYVSAAALRKIQKTQKVRERVEKYAKNTRSNKRKASNVTAAEMTLPLALDNMMLIKTFSSKKRLGALRKEIEIRGGTYGEKETLKKLRERLKEMLNADSEDHAFKLMHSENDATEIMDL